MDETIAVGEMSQADGRQGARRAQEAVGHGHDGSCSTSRSTTTPPRCSRRLRLRGRERRLRGATCSSRSRGQAGGSAAARAGRHHHGPRRPRQDLAARRHPRRQRRRGRGGRHHAAHRRLQGHRRAERQATWSSSTRRATRPSPPCARAAPRPPTSSCWSSPPTTASCRQTIEALNHAKDAEVPIIVAVNKIDKPGAQPGAHQAAALRARPHPRGVGRRDHLRRRLGAHQGGHRPAAAR